jgi:pimeloyl-ACP methyl ester carboxylesterase
MVSAFMPAMRTAFSTASMFAPAFTADIAFRLFCTPRAAGGLSREQKKLAGQAEVRLASSDALRLPFGTGEIQTYHFRAPASGPRRGTVVLVHGWTSAARYMLSFVDPLLLSGFDVVCFDLPAHGKSTGGSTNLRECAHALELVIERFPKVYGIVAHSFGGPVTALALEENVASCVDIQKIVLLASPNAAADCVRDFGGMLGLSPEAQKGFEIEFENLCACPLGEFTGSNYFGRINLPLLVVHSKDDTEVPYAHGLAYRSLPLCQFVPLTSVGHRDILSSPKVVRCVSRFLALPVH